ncbi:hypothetical protein TYRP_018281 [Tyrophagus putrescentiae]|nr:hypothetical protein TYRP_018281 [Tyrophagus putrescentiae]
MLMGGFVLSRAQALKGVKSVSSKSFATWARALVVRRPGRDGQRLQLTQLCASSMCSRLGKRAAQRGEWRSRWERTWAISRNERTAGKMVGKRRWWSKAASGA